MDTSLDKFYIKARSLNLELPEILLSKTAFAVLTALGYLKQRNLYGHPPQNTIRRKMIF